MMNNGPEAVDPETFGVKMHYEVESPWKPVMALTILDGNTLGPQNDVTENTRILTGVRTIHQKTHVGVVSTPTGRLWNMSEYREIIGTARYLGTNFVRTEGGVFPFSDFRQEMQPPIRIGEDSVDPLGFAVDRLLCSKLGCADLIAQGTLSYTSRVAAVMTGTVLHPVDPNKHDGEVYREYNHMLNVIVVVDQGADLFPKETAAYKPLLWGTVGDFNAGVTLRSSSKINPQYDEGNYCVRGMCVNSSFYALQNRALS